MGFKANNFIKVSSRTEGSKSQCNFLLPLSLTIEVFFKHSIKSSILVLHLGKDIIELHLSSFSQSPHYDSIMPYSATISSFGGELKIILECYLNVEMNILNSIQLSLEM